MSRPTSSQNANASEVNSNGANSSTDKSSKAMEWLTRNVSALDDLIDVRWRSLRTRLGMVGPPQVQPYIGYANQTELFVQGRVLTNPPDPLPEKDTHWWENIANMYQRFASDEVADVRLEVRFGNQVHQVVTDHEGYFQLAAAHHQTPPPIGQWAQADIKIIESPQEKVPHRTVPAHVLLPGTSAQFGVISDVDDTIMHTGATQILTMLKVTLLKNARTRIPLEGVSQFYKSLQQGTSEHPFSNPIFYVSSSPWNIFDVLEDFLTLNDIPLGPILLRDLGFDDNKFLKEGHEHKLQKTRRILAAYPDLPFVLIGDSGQDDPWLYARAAEEFGERILGIFIRDIDPEQHSRYDHKVRSAIERCDAVGVPMHLVANSKEAADLCQQMKLIPGASLPEIQEEVKRDQLHNDQVDRLSQVVVQ